VLWDDLWISTRWVWTTSFTSSGSWDEVYQSQEARYWASSYLSLHACLDVMCDGMARTWSAVDWRGGENQGQVSKGEGALVWPSWFASGGQGLPAKAWPSRSLLKKCSGNLRENVLLCSFAWRDSGRRSKITHHPSIPSARLESQGNSESSKQPTHNTHS
jgi:hypothetical protein